MPQSSWGTVSLVRKFVSFFLILDDLPTAGSSALLQECFIAWVGENKQRQTHTHMQTQGISPTLSYSQKLLFLLIKPEINGSWRPLCLHQVHMFGVRLSWNSCMERPEEKNGKLIAISALPQDLFPFPFCLLAFSFQSPQIDTPSGLLVVFSETDTKE